MNRSTLAFSSSSEGFSSKADRKPPAPPAGDGGAVFTFRAGRSWGGIMGNGNGNPIIGMPGMPGTIIGGIPGTPGWKYIGG